MAAYLALFIALGGGSFAVAGALSGKEKRVVKRIAENKANQAIDQRAPGLSVMHAGSADSAASATNAGSAANANHANAADTAADAAALGGVPLAQIALGRAQTDADCGILGVGFTDCVSVQIELAQSHRLLINAAARGIISLLNANSTQSVTCRLEVDNVAQGGQHGINWTGTGFMAGSGIGLHQPIPLGDVTAPLAAGPHQVDVACLGSGAPAVGESYVTAVAIGSG